VEATESPAVKAAFETSLLATEWQNKSKEHLLFPVDPASGTALPDYKPISLGFSSSHAFSPDRRTLAVVSFPNDYAYDGSLLLIDLSTWQVQRFELELRGWVSNIVFSPDGKRLAIAHGDSKYQLSMLDVAKGVITAQRDTDTGYISRLKFTESGDALMLYGPVVKNRFTENEMSAGPPQVFLLDAADLSPLWSAELTGVRDGIYPKDENVTTQSMHEPGQAFYLNPGLAFAPDRDALYIVHADSEQLTTVDFDRQSVETVQIQTKLTWFEQLLSLTAGTAHAKIADGTSKQVAVSPDGQLLYVTGVIYATFQDQRGNWEMTQTPLGLEMIQASDGSRVTRFDTDAAEMSLSPDGHFLYLRRWEGDEPWTEIYDTSERKLITRKTGVFAMPASLISGEFLLASAYSTSETDHHMSVLHPNGSKVLADWTGEDYISWLTTP
jgi:dipeptidyl aminopeptidase/acylaminoacyl peptidase